MTAENAVLRLEGVSKRFDSTQGGPVLEVLRAIDLTVPAGESVAIIGPSGSGKSTLLNIIGTLDRPSAGKVTLGGVDLAGLGDKELAAVRNRRIGFIFQAHHLLPQCSVLENVLVPVLASRDKAQQEAALPRARQLLQRVGLSERLDHLPGQLSGGERQRVAVVRALINRPQLLLADEPTGALDHSTASELAKLLVELNHEEHVTLIVVTHALDLAGLMSRQLELRDKQLHPVEAS